MTSEWMQVMLEEIARKREDAARAREELARRRRAHEPLPPDESGADTPTGGAARPAP